MTIRSLLLASTATFAIPLRSVVANCAFASQLASELLLKLPMRHEGARTHAGGHVPIQGGLTSARGRQRSVALRGRSAATLVPARPPPCVRPDVRIHTILATYMHVAVVRFAGAASGSGASRRGRVGVAAVRQRARPWRRGPGCGHCRHSRRFGDVIDMSIGHANLNGCILEKTDDL